MTIVSGEGVVETPAGMVDVERVRANARKVAEYAHAHGLRWRPHVKTHKSRVVARMQLDAGASGLTVATPREAEVMATVCDDLLLAYPPVGEGRLRRTLAVARHIRLTVGLDSLEALDSLSRGAWDEGLQVGVMVEADVGMARVGLPRPQAVVELARAVADAPSLRFAGLMYYGGHIKGPMSEQGSQLEALGLRVGEFLDALEVAGLPAPCVSGGSTPTLWRSHEVKGLTEIRAGTCIFQDRDQLSLGVCTLEDCAYTVLGTVVSTAVPGQAVLDVGSKALSRDPLRGEGVGFGLVQDHPEVKVVRLSEEHGVLDLSATEWRPTVGDQVAVVPNHVCVSVNLQDRLLARHPDGRLEAWPLEARGRLPFHASAAVAV
ncbi:MAG: alanine racemase [Gemmatimonadota bacterium]